MCLVLGKHGNEGLMVCSFSSKACGTNCTILDERFFVRDSENSVNCYSIYYSTFF